MDIQDKFKLLFNQVDEFGNESEYDSQDGSIIFNLITGKDIIFSGVYKIEK